jgi:RNA polymerase sigma-70 factor (ECF subfamily)
MPALFRTALRFTGRRADAEDLVQDTYLKAFESYQRTSFASSDNLRIWMLKILTNTYLDRYRRQMRSPEVQRAGWTGNLSDNLLEIVPCPQPGPDAELEQKMFCIAVAEAMASLPGDVRIAVTLYFVEGLTYEEIAEATSCPIGTVTSRLWRGRRALRAGLAEFSDQPAIEHNESVPRQRPGGRK